MENIEFGNQLEERTKLFAISIIKLSASLPKTSEFMVIKNQLTKSGTGIGPNYREANRSRSKPDFRNRIMICESEASETLYWLKIIVELKNPGPCYFQKGFRRSKRNFCVIHINRKIIKQTMKLKALTNLKHF